MEIARELGIGLHLPEAGPSVHQARARAWTERFGWPVGPFGRKRAGERRRRLPDRRTCLRNGEQTGNAADWSRWVRRDRAGEPGSRDRDRRNRSMQRSPNHRGGRERSRRYVGHQSIRGSENRSRRDQTRARRGRGSITLNGRETTVAPELTIQEFLNQRGFKDRLVVVEINGKIAAKSSYSVRVFEPNDSVEIVHFVGGG